MSCKKHPKYQAKRRPHGCKNCLAMFLDATILELDKQLKPFGDYLATGETINGIIVYAKKAITVPKTFKGFDVKLAITGKVSYLG